MARLFDSYIIVDWSAASKPTTGADSIWIGALTPDARFRLKFDAINPPTRKDAEDKLAFVIERLLKRGDRILVGFDFPFGYPVGFADAIQLQGPNPPWKQTFEFLSRELKERDGNANNRFPLAARLNRTISNGPFPFWGCPKKDELTTLSVKKSRDHGDGDLREYRHAEQAAMKNKQGRPHTVWKLAYAGAVGGQALTGIPAVHRLRQRFEQARIWPFEFSSVEASIDGTELVLCEVYPSIVPPQLEAGEPKDKGQVRALANHFAQLDEKRALEPLFDLSQRAAPEILPEIFGEEGWTLGI